MCPAANSSLGPDVDERHIACVQAAPKFLGRDGLECVAALEVRLGDLPDLGVAVAAEGLEGEEECGHGFVSKAVPDVACRRAGSRRAALAGARAGERSYS